VGKARLVDFEIVTLGERRDLTGRLYDDLVGAWPPFMAHDPVDVLLDPLVERAWPHLTLLAVNRTTGALAAKAYSLPFAFTGDPDRDLPDQGYDAVVLAAARDRLAGVRGNLLATVELTVAPSAQGRGLAGRLLAEVRALAAAHDYDGVVVPARPAAIPAGVDVADWAARTRPDGLPVDPWLRGQVRAGGRVVGVARRSMVITGTLDRWRAWTGLPFDRSGPVTVPGGLVPVRVDVPADLAVYVEPNVWVRHRLDR
jgi:GNAT superfamily N-acetyltransferase